MITIEMAANLLARDWQRSRTQHFVYSHKRGKTTSKKLVPPIVPDIDEIRKETLAFLKSKNFTHLDFTTESGGGCDTCYYEYPAIAFFGKGKREAFMDINMDNGTTLSQVYEWLAEGEGLVIP
jgi:hypothetical protein